jgi:hypothetical protein
VFCVILRFVSVQCMSESCVRFSVCLRAACASSVQGTLAYTQCVYVYRYVLCMYIHRHIQTCKETGATLES